MKPSFITSGAIFGFVFLVSASGLFTRQAWAEQFMIRPDIEMKISVLTDDPQTQAMLRHYAYFSAEYLTEKDEYQLAQVFYQKGRVKKCLNNSFAEEWLSTLQAKTVNSDEAFDRFLQAEITMAQNSWMWEVWKTIDCSDDLHKIQQDLQTIVNEAYATDLCALIRNSANNANNPLLTRSIQACEETKAGSTQ